MLYNQEEGCDIRHVPLSIAPFFFLQKWARIALGLPFLCWFLWVGAGQMQSHVPCCWWHLAALAGTSLLPGPEPGPASPLLPTWETPLVINFIMRFSKKFSREREEFQPHTSQLLCRAAETPVMLPGFSCCSAKAPAGHWSYNISLLSQSHLPLLSSGPKTLTFLSCSLQLVLPVLRIALLTSSL